MFRRRRIGPMPALILILFGMYAPYAWLVTSRGPWNAYRWTWIRMWPVLPGLFVHLVPAIHRRVEGVGYLAMAAATTLIFLVTVFLARRGCGSLVVVALVVGVLSCLNSRIAYALFLS